MLKPMADVGPDVVHPTLQRTMKQLWDAFDQDGHEMKVTRI